MAFQIVRNDITNMKVDAVVNSANPKVAIGEGVDSAIYQAAGQEELLKARSEVGELLPGEAVITPGFRLPAKYIIHTIGPIWKGGNHGEYDTVKSCYLNSLSLARQKGCESVAFPLISTGTYGFPKDKVLQIAISCISQFLLEYEMSVYLVVYDKRSYELSGKLFQGVEEFINDNYIKKQKKRRLDYSRYEERRLITDYVEGIDEPFICLNQEAMTPCEKSRSLDDVMDNIGDSFQQMLLRLIDAKGLTDVEVYKKANLNRKLFSKIRCNNDYKPKKKTALALAVALRLNLDETKDLLSRAGLALSPNSKFDLIIEYFIGNEVYDIYTINMALFQYDQQILGE